MTEDYRNAFYSAGGEDDDDFGVEDYEELEDDDEFDGGDFEGHGREEKDDDGFRTFSLEELVGDNELFHRPVFLEEFVGQEMLKNKLSTSIKAAKQKNEALEHVLFYGPPGLGKTSLANIIAKRMGGRLRIAKGSARARESELAAALSNLEHNDVLVIDAIHRLPPKIVETLISAMEDFVLRLTIGKGEHANRVQLPLSKFTLIGATTRLDLCSSSLLTKFGMVEELAPYSNEELVPIVTKGAWGLDVSISEGVVKAVAARSKGTPKIALRILKRVCELAMIRGLSSVDENFASAALDFLCLDSCGLGKWEKRILRAIVELFDGGPVELSALSAVIKAESEVVEDLYEPYLLQQKFIEITQQERRATRRAWEYLGKTPPD